MYVRVILGAWIGEKNIDGRYKDVKTKIRVPKNLNVLLIRI